MKGSCLCGQVQYTVRGPTRSVVACHCTQCRKTSGHYVAATRSEQDQLDIQGAENITWYRSSDWAQRGFCRTCGSQLFWKRLDNNKVSIMAGTIDGPTGLKMDRQLHPEMKGDYYDLPDVEPYDQSVLAKEEI